MFGDFVQHDLGAFGERKTRDARAHGGKRNGAKILVPRQCAGECAVEDRNARAVVSPPSCMLAAWIT